MIPENPGVRWLPASFDASQGVRVSQRGANRGAV